LISPGFCLVPWIENPAFTAFFLFAKLLI